MAVDREFAYISFMCIYFFVICGPLLHVLGTTLGLHLDTLGRLGLPRHCPWHHFAFLWLPWDAGGTIWGTLGSKVELGVTLG